MTRRVPPEELFQTLAPGSHGHFHLDCLVVKRTVFDKTGLFDEHLRLAQDTAVIYKMVALARLAPGWFGEPVATRRIHSQNHISSPRLQSETYRMRMMFCFSSWLWSKIHLDQER